MAKSNNMKDLLKQRMSAAQQVSEMEIGNRAYESLTNAISVHSIGSSYRVLRLPPSCLIWPLSTIAFRTRPAVD